MADQSASKGSTGRRAEHFLRPKPRSTPCVGICSTSHGDYVCRGCKRFFNEVRDWQSFEPDQRELVLNRLAQLKRDSIQAVVNVGDAQVLCRQTEAFVPAEAAGDMALRIYEALGRCNGDYEGWGLQPPVDVRGFEDPIEVLKTIETFFYDASRNKFEQIYKIRPR
ncbi:MAG: DUF1289 domain-containing protein [Gammaproteobacteria bacterium]|nr:DUF1289 domain-containing protein [Gammaproteobacteria bacterium]